MNSEGSDDRVKTCEDCVSVFVPVLGEGFGWLSLGYLQHFRSLRGQFVLTGKKSGTSWLLGRTELIIPGSGKLSRFPNSSILGCASSASVELLQAMFTLKTGVRVLEGIGLHLVSLLDLIIDLFMLVDVCCILRSQRFDYRPVYHGVQVRHPDMGTVGGDGVGRVDAVARSRDHRDRAARRGSELGH